MADLQYEGVSGSSSECLKVLARKSAPIFDDHRCLALIMRLSG